MKKIVFLLLTFIFTQLTWGQKDSIVTKRDRKKDVLLETSMGNIWIRLSDSTPLHRDNFIKLVKTNYYPGILFHRVIQNFMIQSGDPDSRGAAPGVPLGNGGPDYLIPAEFRPTLFHKKGVIAAARDNHPQKASSASQFYLTQGKVFTEAGLDSVETYRLKRKIPADQRKVYTTLGGVPHLDQNYTVFGEIVKGLEVVDKIAAVPTSKGPDKDRPLQDVKIIDAKLVKRKKH
ncbi:MAG: peptidylprolyl isomerase [Chitinophagaceae bacterium]|jgi:peptidyl-prolyl cis-trans isomerase B (cyclophilin B)|nr:peptidylprolyl isomerase [Chitinophagaceae bacterium]NCW87574.1 peptidylprolyl isomerase [Chitinophagia bacterium]NDB52503.1 peptidylprolyl isomerase [Chitinophagaceae bacterium]NDE77756.1 peptidylprolyl isomerase [Chitinophagaceae bacterium]HAL95337.1 peptidylprolyl isomerase [Chitinophagaceae bacterium]